MTKQDLMLCRCYAYLAVIFTGLCVRPIPTWIHGFSCSMLVWCVLMIAIKIAEGVTRDKSGTEANQSD